MSHDPFSQRLHDEVETLTRSAVLLAPSSLHRAARRRRLATIAMSMGVIAVAGAVTAAVAGMLPRQADRLEGPASKAPSTMPDLRGADRSDAAQRLRAVGLDLGEYVPAYFASATVPRDTVLDQSPPPGGQLQRAISLTFSAGGPVIALDAVPAAYARALRADPRIDEQAPAILLLETPAGRTYKSDDVLVGPCAAVAYAEHEMLNNWTSDDPAAPRDTYETRCFD